VRRGEARRGEASLSRVEMCCSGEFDDERLPFAWSVQIVDEVRCSKFVRAARLSLTNHIECIVGRGAARSERESKSRDPTIATSFFLDNRSRALVLAAGSHLANPSPNQPVA
jgi:hypothetical protein